MMQEFFRTAVLIVAAGLIGPGCKERTRIQPPSAVAEQTEPVSQTPEAAPLASVATDAKTALNDINTALAKHDLEKATVSLVQVGLSGQPLSDAQRTAYQSSMRNLQAQLADAAARNDPKANEMIQLLKAARGK
jgi:hypothetical protein